MRGSGGVRGEGSARTTPVLDSSDHSEICFSFAPL